jgi:hypothetical protein
MTGKNHDVFKMNNSIPLCAIIASLSLCSAQAAFAEAPRFNPSQRGYRHLRETPYLPPDFDADVFHQLRKRWPEPLRSKAAKATPQQRRKTAFERYGLILAVQFPSHRGTGPSG